MDIIYVPNCFNDFAFNAKSTYDVLLTEVPWVNREAPRDECFMALESAEYTYGTGFKRTYNSVPLHSFVDYAMWRLNFWYNSQYNVCFLNYYKSEKEHLGWHSDNSPEMDINHPIAVVSFGAEREIWVKNKDYKGEIPKENRYKLSNGSIFIMPAGYQNDHMHKIPKPDKPCGGRISLTFRKFIKKES